MSSPAALLAQHCCPRELALSDSEIAAHLALLPHWSLVDGKLQRAYKFGNYYQTMAFVGALAYQCHNEDHHPELVVTYSRVLVKYDTHSVNRGQGGLSENDFICAAKADALYAQGVQDGAMAKQSNAMKKPQASGEDQHA